MWMPLALLLRQIIANKTQPQTSKAKRGCATLLSSTAYCLNRLFCHINAYKKAQLIKSWAFLWSKSKTKASMHLLVGYACLREKVFHFIRPRLTFRGVFIATGFQCFLELTQNLLLFVG